MRYLLVWCIFFCSKIGYTQSNFFFRHNYDTVPQSWAIDVKYANGKIYEYGFNEKPGWSTEELHLGVFDAMGNLEKLFKYDTNADSTYYTPGLPGSLMVGRDSFIYGAGWQLTAQNESQGELFKWSPNGELAKHYSINKDSSIILLFIAQSGGYIYAYGGITDSFKAERSSVFLVKLDTGLNVIWDRRLKWDKINIARGVFATADSGVVFGATTGGSSQKDWYSRLIKMDNNGSVVSDYVLPVGKGDTYLLDYNRINGDILTKTYRYLPNQLPNNNDLTELHVNKLDSSLNIQWSKKWIANADYPTITIYNDFRNGVKINDYYLLCGDNVQGGWVICLSEEGDKVWEASYMDLQGVKTGIYPTNYYLTGMDTLPDDRGYVLSGSTSDTLSRQVAFIMSIDKDGCFSDDTCEAKQYVSITYYAPAIRAQVFPNPFTNTLQIKIENAQLNGAELIITDLLGRTVAREKLQTELTTFSTQDWAAGMYVWSLVEDGLVVKSGKVVKE